MSEPTTEITHNWFREQYERAKERNAQIPPHARMAVTNPTLSAHVRTAAGCICLPELLPAIAVNCRADQHGTAAQASTPPAGGCGMTAQFAVRAENGKTAYSSEEVARRAAVEGGWTLNDSPIVAALTRDDETAEWRDLDVRSSPGEMS